MSFRKIPPLLLSAMVAIWILSAQSDATVKALRGVMVPARDGVKLGTNVILPAKSDTAGQRFPALVERTPYNKDGASGPAIEYFVSHGYAVVIQDVRGR